MAGAGYKLFNSGDVLTAAQVNTYLMEQTVMVFNDAAARTTALSGVLSEGMISYLKDTNATEVYNGSAWVGITGDGDITGVTAGTGISGGGTTGTVTITNDMATTITASGDIIVGTGSGTYDNLPIGTTGQVLTADTTVSPYKVKWAAAAGGADFVAGKNKIINGDFYWNQRAFSSTTSANTYMFDRWVTKIGGNGTSTYTAQTFTPGTAPVSGYEGRNFIQIATTGQTTTAVQTRLTQIIESCRIFAGQTVTLSFWARATSGTPSVAYSFYQDYGTGGSPSAGVVINGDKTAITTSWARYSFTVSIPSISGKTIGTNNDDALWMNLWTSAGSDNNSATNSLGIQTATIQFWGVQLEAGSTATPFTTATGTIQGELAACQRYYVRYTATDAYGMLGVGGWTYSATNFWGNHIRLPHQFRVPPSSVDYSALQVIDTSNGTYTVSAVALSSPSLYNGSCEFTISGGTTGRIGTVRLNNNTAGYLGFSAEL